MLSWLKIWSVTSWSLFLSLCLGVVAVTGDRTVARCNSNICRAVADSCTHCLIGLLTWLVVSVHNKNDFGHMYEICACGLLSSLIDIDHFIAARSLKLKDALTLTSRPFLHCSSVLLSVCVVFITVSNAFHFKELPTLGWISLAAFLSHHIRDASRRGFWIWPFGSTPPIPYNAYITLTVFLPIMLLSTMQVFNALPKTYYKDVLEV